MRIKRRIDSPLKKKARRGFRGYPAATIAFYGPDNTRASKVAVGVMAGEGVDPIMERWYSDLTDLRRDPDVAVEIVKFLQKHGALSVAMVDGIIRCPHEEGIDYPDGGNCPKCPYWFNRERFTGELLR